MSKVIRWGILGAGKIANDFAYGLSSVQDAKLLSVGSVQEKNRIDFCKAFPSVRAYCDYESLVKDPDVDVIYIATPNSMHFQNMNLCLAHNKPFLCEKPFALNSGEAKKIFLIAKEKKIFCMEAMWMRFMPLIKKTKQLIKDGAVGDVLNFSAGFGYPTEFDVNNRFFNLDMGGGSLLDRGVYPISLAFYLFGKPSYITASAHFGGTKVDEQIAIIFRYSDGKLAQLFSSLTSYSSNSVIIMGTKGKIIIDPPFCRPNKIILEIFSEKPVVLSSKFSKAYPYEETRTNIISEEILGNGFCYEAIEVGNCIRAGKLESDIMSHNETIEILEAIDEIKILCAK